MFLKIVGLAGFFSFVLGFVIFGYVLFHGPFQWEEGRNTGIAFVMSITLGTVLLKAVSEEKESNEDSLFLHR